MWWPPTSAPQEGGGLNKGAVPSASTSFWEKGTPPALILKPDKSVSPCMSLTPFELLPQSWSSEHVSQSASKSMCGPLKKNVFNSSSPLFHSATLFTGFHNQKLWRTSLPTTGTLGWGVLCGAGTPSSSGDTSAAEISLPILNLHTWMWGQPILHLYPSYQFQCEFFCIALFIRLLFS